MVSFLPLLLNKNINHSENMYTMVTILFKTHLDQGRHIETKSLKCSLPTLTQKYIPQAKPSIQTGRYGLSLHVWNIFSRKHGSQDESSVSTKQPQFFKADTNIREESHTKQREMGFNVMLFAIIGLRIKCTFVIILLHRSI